MDDKTLQKTPSEIHDPFHQCIGNGDVMYFLQAETARRYALYRPKVHHIVLSWLSELSIHFPVEHALDVACGTGDSMLPLLQVAKHVEGIDCSTEMLHYAREKQLSVTEKSLEMLTGENHYDLISVCMAFHWLDTEVALSVFKRISTDHSIWVIYDFSFAGHEISDEFNCWFRDSFLVEYSTPSRHEVDYQYIAGMSGVNLLKQDQGFLSLQLDRVGLVHYLTTMSNVEAIVASGRSYEEVEHHLLSELSQFDWQGHFRYRYKYWIYQYNQ